MAEEDQFRLVQPMAQIVRDLHSVSRHLVDGQTRIDPALGAAERVARAGLVPLGDDEVLLEIGEAEDVPALGVARTSVHDQQHRLGAVLASHGDPLVLAADPHEGCFVDTGGAVDRDQLRRLMLHDRAVAQAGAGQQQDQDEQARRATADDGPDTHAITPA